MSTWRRSLAIVILLFAGLPLMAAEEPEVWREMTVDVWIDAVPRRATRVLRLSSEDGARVAVLPDGEARGWIVDEGDGRAPCSSCRIAGRRGR